MQADPAWEGAGKNEGMEAWRIENKKPVPVKEEDYKQGSCNLYTGDSYLFLWTYKSSAGGLLWNLHFWLGRESSVDEMGIAAYKTVELDEYLKGGPVQYREVQDNESPLFCEYFSGGLQYCDGGVESGFRKVERDKYPTRLFQIKGKKFVRSVSVNITNKELTTQDVFILDKGLKLYQFTGPLAGPKKKIKALQMITRIKDNERSGRADIIHIADEDAKHTDFWDTLGGYLEPDQIREGMDDEEWEVQEDGEVVLMEISNEGGSISHRRVNTENNGWLQRNYLKTEEVYFLDNGEEIFVWIGKGAADEEKREGMAYAQKYLVENNMPITKSIFRMVEGAETELFKDQFPQWEKVAPPAAVNFEDARKSFHSGKVAKTQKQKGFDFEQIFDGSVRYEDDDEMEHDAGEGIGSTSSIVMWRIEDMKKVEVNKKLYGQFYSGDSYIVLYTFLKPGVTKQHYIIYFWQGRGSTADEKGGSALIAKDLDDEMGGAPIQCRVVQGKEPVHFCQLWQGKMLVHQGGRASAFKNKDAEDEYDTDGTALYHVKGVEATDTRAVQVDECARYLSSRDCFILFSPKAVYLWAGIGCNETERTTARDLGQVLLDTEDIRGLPDLDRPLIEVAEGKETEDFWNFLGGKDEYPKLTPEQCQVPEPRFFLFSNSSGMLDCTEIVTFAQEDLDLGDIVLLDCFTEYYLWIGNDANDTEKDMCKDLTHQYLAVASKREPDRGSEIIYLEPGKEPLSFTQHFVGWDKDFLEKTKYVDVYEKLKAERRKTLENTGTVNPAIEALRRMQAKKERRLAEESGSGEGKSAGARRRRSSIRDPPTPAQAKERALLAKKEEDRKKKMIASQQRLQERQRQKALATGTDTPAPPSVAAKSKISVQGPTKPQIKTAKQQDPPPPPVQQRATQRQQQPRPPPQQQQTQRGSQAASNRSRTKPPPTKPVFAGTSTEVRKQQLASTVQAREDDVVARFEAQQKKERGKKFAKANAPSFKDQLRQSTAAREQEVMRKFECDEAEKRRR